MKPIFIAVFLLATNLAVAQQVKHYTLDSLATKQMNELITRRTVSGEHGTFGLFTMKKSAIVPLHHHTNEQFTFILKGSVKVTIEGKIYIVKAGDCIIIPPNVPHLFESLEDGTVDLDFFAPKREDWINGTDSYFKKS
jgi:quercetin dioxygenase-like cupin family protein